jgi:hypothetical protein
MCSAMMALKETLVSRISTLQEPNMMHSRTWRSIQPHPDSTPDVVYSVYLVYLARIEMRHVTRNIDIEHRNEACERFSTKKKNEGGPWGHDTDILTYIY